MFDLCTRAWNLLEYSGKHISQKKKETKKPDSLQIQKPMDCWKKNGLSMIHTLEHVRYSIEKKYYLRERRWMKKMLLSGSRQCIYSNSSIYFDWNYTEWDGKNGAVS